MSRVIAHLLMLVCAVGIGSASSAQESSPREVLQLEVTLPPVGYVVREPGRPPRPSLAKTDLTRYADRGEPQTKLRELLRQARVLLWTTSPIMPPYPLLPEVSKARKELKGALFLVDRIPIPTTPAMDKGLKDRILTSGKQLARIVASLESLVDQLKELESLREKENLRWQAHYDLTLAWLQLRIVYLEELGLALGTMRKEYPEYDAAIHKAFQLQTQEVLRDVPSRKRFREAEKLLQQLVKEHPGSVWADLAQEALKKQLSVKWVPVK